MIVCLSYQSLEVAVRARLGSKKSQAHVPKVLVFADFVGYSRLADANVAAFQQAFWSIVAATLAATGGHGEARVYRLDRR